LKEQSSISDPDTMRRQLFYIVSTKKFVVESKFLVVIAYDL